MYLGSVLGKLQVTGTSSHYAIVKPSNIPASPVVPQCRCFSSIWSFLWNLPTLRWTSRRYRINPPMILSEQVGNKLLWFNWKKFFQQESTIGGIVDGQCDAQSLWNVVDSNSKGQSESWDSFLNKKLANLPRSLSFQKKALARTQRKRKKKKEERLNQNSTATSAVPLKKLKKTVAGSIHYPNPNVSCFDNFWVSLFSMSFCCEFRSFFRGFQLPLQRPHLRSFHMSFTPGFLRDQLQENLKQISAGHVIEIFRKEF